MANVGEPTYKLPRSLCAVVTPCSAASVNHLAASLSLCCTPRPSMYMTARLFCPLPCPDSAAVLYHLYGEMLQFNVISCVATQRCDGGQHSVVHDPAPCQLTAVRSFGLPRPRPTTTITTCSPATRRALTPWPHVRRCLRCWLKASARR
jgi:hypothetical protein